MKMTFVKSVVIVLKFVTGYSTGSSLYEFTHTHQAINNEQDDDQKANKNEDLCRF